MNKKIFVWIIAMISLIPSVFAQLFTDSSTGSTFVTVGILIFITIFVFDLLRRNMKGPQ